MVEIEGYVTIHVTAIPGRYAFQMTEKREDAELGPLLTIRDDELSRPARRREDRDVLVLRVEIEAQRREVSRLRAIVAAREPFPTEPQASKSPAPAHDRLLLSAKDLRHSFGISSATLYKWVRDGQFPLQIHVGSLARWRRDEVEAWLHAKMQKRATLTIVRDRPEFVKKVHGGRSRWSSAASAPFVTETKGIRWQPQPTPIRGTGWKLLPGAPEPLTPEHPDYRTPRYRIDDAARYVGLPKYRTHDLLDIPHGRTRAMHYCFAQSDLDEFKSTFAVKKRKSTKN